MSLQRNIRLIKAIVLEDWAGFDSLVGDAEFDLPAFLKFSRRNHLIEYLFVSLADAGRDGAVLNAHRDSLQTQHLRLLHSEELLTETLLELRRSFTAGEIPFVLLKGLYFTHRYYGKSGKRSSWDIDMLVKDEDFTRAGHLLEAESFTPRQPLSRWPIRRLVHATGYRRGNTLVDLHRKLRVRPAYRIDYGKLWRSNRAFPIGNTDYLALSDEYSLLFTVLGNAHDLEAGKAKLKTFLDLYYILRAMDPEVDWDEFFAARRSENLEVMAVNLLQMFVLVWDWPEQFPELCEALDRRRGLLDLAGPAQALELFGNLPGKLRNKLWFSRIYPGSRYGYLTWWALSAPLRYAAAMKT